MPARSSRVNSSMMWSSLVVAHQRWYRIGRPLSTGRSGRSVTSIRPGFRSPTSHLGRRFCGTTGPRSSSLIRPPHALRRCSLRILHIKPVPHGHKRSPIPHVAAVWSLPPTGRPSGYETS